MVGDTKKKSRAPPNVQTVFSRKIKHGTNIFGVGADKFKVKELSMERQQDFIISSEN